MQKKGNILGWFIIIIVLLVTAISVIISLFVTNVAQESGIFDGYPEAQNNINQAETAILSWDNVFLFIVIGLSIFLIISSAMVYNHPVFFIIGFFALLIAISLSAVISNTFYSLQISDTLSATADKFPKIKFLMENLPIYVLLMGAGCLISGYVGGKG